jgi:hypothetical protein
VRDQPARMPRRRLARLWPALGLAGALVVLALAGQVTSGSLRVTPTTTPERRATPTTALPPSPVTATVRLDADPQQVAVGAGAVWVADGPVVRRVDPVTNKVAANVQVGSGQALIRNVAADERSVWAVVGEPGEIVRIDPASNQVMARIPAGRRLLAPVGLALAGDSVWVSCCALEPGLAGELLRVDALAGRIAARLPMPQGPLAITADPSAVWVTTAAGQVLQIDLLTGKVARWLGPFGDGSRPQAVAVSARELWLGDPGQGAVLVVDKQSGRLTAKLRTAAATQLALDAADVWFVSSNDRGLTRAAQRDARVTGAVPLVQLRDLKAVAVGAGAVWVTTGRALVRVDPGQVAALAS